MKELPDWRLNIGPALEASGTALMSAGAIGGLAVASPVLAWTAFCGFVLKAAGMFFSKLWPKDEYGGRNDGSDYGDKVDGIQATTPIKDR